MALHASERLQSSYRPPLSICFFCFFFLLFLHCLTLFTRMNRNSCFLKEYKFSVLHFVFHKTKLRNAHAWRFKNLTKDQIDRNQYRQILRCWLEVSISFWNNKAVGNRDYCFSSFTKNWDIFSWWVSVFFYFFIQNRILL